MRSLNDREFFIQTPVFFCSDAIRGSKPETVELGGSLTVDVGQNRALAMFTDADLAERFRDEYGLTSLTIVGFHDLRKVVQYLKTQQTYGIGFVCVDPSSVGRRPPWTGALQSVIEAIETAVEDP